MFKSSSNTATLLILIIAIVVLTVLSSVIDREVSDGLVFYKQKDFDEVHVFIPKTRGYMHPSSVGNLPPIRKSKEIK